MVLLDGVDSGLENMKPLKRYRPLAVSFSVFKNLCLIVFFSTIVFFSVNLPAYLTIYRYKMDPGSFVDHTRLTDLKAPDVKQLGDNKLFIPKISLEAPIQWDVQSEQIMNDLPNGLVHPAGSGKPGEGENAFITGHSSNYWWKSGGYNTVFALLPEIKEGDEISLTYNGKIYNYVVSKTVEAKPSEVNNYLNSDNEQLTLMTCVPVGTNLRRLLVIAKPV